MIFLLLVKEMPERGLHFYTELVIVTVLSLIAAKAWFHWFIRFLNKYAGTSLHVDFFAVAILTVISIFGLHLLFSKKVKATDLPLPQADIYRANSDLEEDFDQPQARYLK